MMTRVRLNAQHKKLRDTFLILMNHIVHARMLQFSSGIKHCGSGSNEKRMKLKVGDLFPSKTLRTVAGKEVRVPDGGLFIHLQFRRFVGCPICNTHIAEMMKRAAEIKSTGIREVIFFHSRAEEIRPMQEGVPFDLVADAEKVYYKEFGVGTSLAHILS